MHDEEHFPDPHTFNPDRFLNFGTIQSEPQSHETSADETRDGGQDWSNNGGDPLSVIFGFGRRWVFKPLVGTQGPMSSKGFVLVDLSQNPGFG